MLNTNSSSEFDQEFIDIPTDEFITMESAEIPSSVSIKSEEFKDEWEDIKEENEEFEEMSQEMLEESEEFLKMKKEEEEEEKQKGGKLRTSSRAAAQSGQEAGAFSKFY